MDNKNFWILLLLGLIHKTCVIILRRKYKGCKMFNSNLKLVLNVLSVHLIKSRQYKKITGLNQLNGNRTNHLLLTFRPFGLPGFKIMQQTKI